MGTKKRTAKSCRNTSASTAPRTSEGETRTAHNLNPAQRERLRNKFGALLAKCELEQPADPDRLEKTGSVAPNGAEPQDSQAEQEGQDAPQCTLETGVKSDSPPGPSETVARSRLDLLVLLPDKELLSFMLELMKMEEEVWQLQIDQAKRWRRAPLPDPGVLRFGRTADVIDEMLDDLQASGDAWTVDITRCGELLPDDVDDRPGCMKLLEEMAQSQARLRELWIQYEHELSCFRARTK